MVRGSERTLGVKYSVERDKETAVLFWSASHVGQVLIL